MNYSYRLNDEEWSHNWFLENANRYDNYDRSGPKVFAGEYAAHPRDIEGYLENNWRAAIAEAAFMTGLERNADIVHLTSYAPLMAHSDAYQWAPDLIWFNNLESYGTVNYYVQKMYSTNAGTDLLKITHNSEPLSGQDNLYASAVKDVNTNELIIKVVNTATEAQTLFINIKGAKPASEATTLMMVSDDLNAANSFNDPKKISPIEGKVNLKKGILETSIPANAFVIYKIKI